MFWMFNERKKPETTYNVHGTSIDLIVVWCVKFLGGYYACSRWCWLVIVLAVLVSMLAGGCGCVGVVITAVGVVED